MRQYAKRYSRRGLSLGFARAKPSREAISLRLPTILRVVFRSVGTNHAYFASGSGKHLRIDGSLDVNIVPVPQRHEMHYCRNRN